MDIWIPTVFLICIPAAALLWAITALLTEIRTWTLNMRNDAWSDIQRELAELKAAKKELQNAARQTPPAE
jgi:hypothetical protein